jgi:hypothetical protein
MQNVTELMPKNGQNQVTAPLTQRTFDQDSVNLTQYFFARIRSVYGIAKFEKTWPTETDVKVAKREWCNNIGKFTKQEINKMLKGNMRKIAIDQFNGVQLIDYSQNINPLLKSEYKITRIMNKKLISDKDYYDFLMKFNLDAVYEEVFDLCNLIFEMGRERGIKWPTT